MVENLEMGPILGLWCVRAFGFSNAISCNADYSQTRTTIRMGNFVYGKIVLVV